MNKRVVIKFIKDKLFTFIMFFLCCFFIILYNYLKLNSVKVLLYSLVLYLFMMSIYILCEFIKYYKFNCELENEEVESNHNLMLVTEEQKNFERKLICMQNHYIQKLNEITLQERNKRYFFLSGYIV